MTWNLATRNSHRTRWRRRQCEQILRFNSLRMDDRAHSVTRITQAYISLSSAPKGKYGERTISIARIRNYEIRMVESCPSDMGDSFLFWIELFDHDIQSTVEGCRCCEIEDGVAGFEQFFEQATTSKSIVSSQVCAEQQP
jgi:hypothetical protein